MVNEEHGNAHYSDADFIDAVRDNEPTSSIVVAQEIGCTKRTAISRLNDLRDRGVIDGTMIGNSTMWTLNEDSE